jgi:REP element-mobilizing transposase RayT
MPIYHGKDLRIGRYSETGRPYLVTTVTRKREPLFKDFYLARLLVNVLRHCEEQGRIYSYAWVVMPDHLHWLLAPRASPLAATMQLLKSRSALAVNRRRRQRGPVWQKGYHDHAIRRDEDLVATARYIVANPLRAGIVRRLGDYPHWDAVWL